MSTPQDAAGFNIILFCHKHKPLVIWILAATQNLSKSLVRPSFHAIYFVYLLLVTTFARTTSQLNMSICCICSVRPAENASTPDQKIPTGQSCPLNLHLKPLVNNYYYYAQIDKTGGLIRVCNFDHCKIYFQFPLLSKSSLLKRLIIEASQDGVDEVYLNGIPGGAKAFEICAKFCYGMVVTLNPYNVVAARCAAEYLVMTEDVDKSNLVFKIEVFLNSGVFRSWKDSIIALQSTVALLPWSEELKLVVRCVDSIAAKATASPGTVVWSYTYNRKAASSDEIVEARRCSSSSQAVPRDWWVEDLCELDVELYKRVMVAVKSRGRVPPDVLGEALRAYAARWLPESCRDTPANYDDACSMEVLETIVWLMPSDDNGSSSCCCSCQFLLNLLKLAVLVGAGELLREELMDRVALQLHEASVSDLLIPARPPTETSYDVQLVEALVDRYMRGTGVAGDGTFLDGLDREDGFETNVEADEPLLALCKLVDGYLAEVAADPNLQVSSFVGLATSMPESARPAHDGLYTAIDVFLKVHLTPV